MLRYVICYVTLRYVVLCDKDVDRDSNSMVGLRAVACLTKHSLIKK